MSWSSPDPLGVLSKLEFSGNAELEARPALQDGLGVAFGNRAGDMWCATVSRTEGNQGLFLYYGADPSGALSPENSEMGVFLSDVLPNVPVSVYSFRWISDTCLQVSLRVPDEVKVGGILGGSVRLQIRTGVAPNEAAVVAALRFPSDHYSGGQRSYGARKRERQPEGQ